MPFNSSGIFSRLFSWVADRDAGVQILASKMDDEMNGMEAAFNDITAGAVPLRGNMRTVNGTAAAPAWSFTSDTDTGVYRAGADILGLSAGAGDLRISPTVATYNGSNIMHEGMTSLEVGRGNTTAGNRWLDFNVDGTSATDHNARIFRGTGANGNFTIVQTGTGAVQVNGGSAFTRDGAMIWTDANAPTSQHNVVGSLAFLQNRGSASVGGNQVVPGADLRFAGIRSDGSIQIGATPAGTWRCLGVADINAVTLFVRQTL